MLMTCNVVKSKMTSANAQTSAVMFVADTLVQGEKSLIGAHMAVVELR